MSLAQPLVMAIKKAIENILDSKEKKFWKWFEKHSQELLESNDVDSEIWRALHAKLLRIANGLVFEFSIDPDEKPKKFVISADGLEHLVRDVEKLYDARPELPDWKIIKFRPRLTGYSLKTRNGVELDGDTKYLFVDDDDPKKVGILLFAKDFKDDLYKDFCRLAIVYLQMLLGEYDFIHHVGVIDIFGFDSEYYPHSKPVTEMTQEFDKIFGKEKECLMVF